MSRFYFGDSETSSNGSDDDLPYPVPLARSAFLTPDFCPTTYLSTLRNRHQTLEDLRSELRTRSQDLSKELLDLVNTNYQDFLNLGGSLRGGEEKVEGVRMGLLGFKRDIESVRTRITEREGEIGSLIRERAAIRRQLSVARVFLEISGRLEELEGSLMVDADGTKFLPESHTAGTPDSNASVSESEDSDLDHEDATPDKAGLISLRRLRRLVQQYLLLQHLITRTGPHHPFLHAQESRMVQIRNTLLLDLKSALVSAQTSVEARRTFQVMKVMNIYRDLGEAGAAVIVLSSGKS